MSSANAVDSETVRRSFPRKLGWLVLIALVGAAMVSQHAGAEGPAENDQVTEELAAMGKRGVTIERARQRVLEVLQQPSACSEWFQEADTDAEAIFRSLHYDVVDVESTYTSHSIDGRGVERWKHPWAAMTYENSGRNSHIRLNAKGAFFRAISPVVNLEAMHWVGPPVSQRALRVGRFSGDTLEAQMTTLLHELGHVIGRIPADSDSWDGRSAENTAQVLRHCGAQIRVLSKSTVRESD